MLSFVAKQKISKNFGRKKNILNLSKRTAPTSLLNFVKKASDLLSNRPLMGNLITVPTYICNTEAAHYLKDTESEQMEKFRRRKQPAS